MEIQFPVKIPSQSKQEYIREHAEFFRDLWRQGQSYRNIARSLYDKTGYRFTKSDFYAGLHLSVKDKIDRLITVENKKIINNHNL